MGVDDQFDPTNYGVFSDSEGLAALSQMDLEQSPEFYGMSRNCEGCGQRKQAQIEWAELYCLQYGVNPAVVGEIMSRQDIFDTKWTYDSHFRCYHPEYRCSCHGNPLVLFNMTPREAERVLHASGRNGIIGDPQKLVIRAISTVVKRISQGVSPAQVAAEFRNAAQRSVGPAGPGSPQERARHQANQMRRR